MKIRVAARTRVLIVSRCTPRRKSSLVGATVINPADGKVLPNATVVITGTRLNASRWANRTLPRWETVSCVGKFILPGYIDTHVHFFQSADLFTRPDGADFNSVRPYKEEVAWIKSHVDDVFARYIRSGITSVVDVGGPMWNFEVRKKANATAKAPRVAAAGPAHLKRLARETGSRRSANRKIDTPDQAREFVRKLAEQNRIWSRSGTSSTKIIHRCLPAYRPRDDEESHAHKIRSRARNRARDGARGSGRRRGRACPQRD